MDAWMNRSVKPMQQERNPVQHSPKSLCTSRNQNLVLLNAVNTKYNSVKDSQPFTDANINSSFTGRKRES